jgi:hypothetical protein
MVLRMVEVQQSIVSVHLAYRAFSHPDRLAYKAFRQASCRVERAVDVRRGAVRELSSGVLLCTGGAQGCADVVQVLQYLAV